MNSFKPHSMSHVLHNNLSFLIRKEQKCIVCRLINIPLLVSLAPSQLSDPFPVVSAGERCVITWEISGYGVD